MKSESVSFTSACCTDTNDDDDDIDDDINDTDNDSDGGPIDIDNNEYFDIVKNDTELRSGVGSIPAWADYLVEIFPKFSPTVRRMSEFERCHLLDIRRNFQYRILWKLWFGYKRREASERVAVVVVVVVGQQASQSCVAVKPASRPEFDLSVSAAMSLPPNETLRGHSDSSFRGEGYIQCCVGVRLCDMYSNQELAEIHFMYGKADGNAALARRLYQERYPQRQCPDRKTFVRLHYRLCEYGKFNSPGLGRGRPRSTTPEVQEEILEAVNMTPSISTRRVALQVNVPHTTVWRLLKEYELYPYHLQRGQYRPCHQQITLHELGSVRFSLNMWAGIIGDRLVGPHALVNRLTGQAYTNFLENTIPHVLEDTPLINRQHIHFLHDGAPAHFSRTARRYLDRRFPDRWIGRGGPIAWPPRSPDLKPLDFYLWGHLKSLVYSSPVPDLESLRNRIVACSEDIRNTPGVWDRVRR
ncbi:hypothetical protein ANN_22525 [Periplaneta americana]|uniref:DUF4817 domain-containing protein n=1 Tax=Periplaneta americana TaxID=6978 RepID=A0ABQ8S9C9_PERAM|nr:hypothetical protein ANN_22525 [Periplaneta americana]